MNVIHASFFFCLGLHKLSYANQFGKGSKLTKLGKISLKNVNVQHRLHNHQKEFFKHQQQLIYHESIIKKQSKIKARIRK